MGGATFEEKLEALRKIREKQLAKKAAESPAQASEAPAEPAEPAPAPGPDPSEADALFCAGHCHERGIHGFKVDLAAAQTMYRLAAEQGHVVSQWRLGELYESGLDGQVAKDPREAHRWYLLAAEGGNAQAQSALALMLEDGLGVLQDAEAALKWHLAAAEQGNALSQYCAAGLLSKRGELEAAESWLKKSAAQGFRPAAQVLAEFQPEPAPASGDVVGLAGRIAQQLQHLDDVEAEQLLEQLLQECHLAPDAGSEEGCATAGPAS